MSAAWAGRSTLVNTWNTDDEEKRICTRMHAHAQTRAYTQTHTYTCIYTRTHAGIYTHTHTQIHKGMP